MIGGQLWNRFYFLQQGFLLVFGFVIFYLVIENGDDADEEIGNGRC